MAQATKATTENAEENQRQRIQTRCPPSEAENTIHSGLRLEGKRYSGMVCICLCLPVCLCLHMSVGVSLCLCVSCLSVGVSSCLCRVCVCLYLLVSALLFKCLWVSRRVCVCLVCLWSVGVSSRLCPFSKNVFFCRQRPGTMLSKSAKESEEAAETKRLKTSLCRGRSPSCPGGPWQPTEAWDGGGMVAGWFAFQLF